MQSAKRFRVSSMKKTYRDFVEVELKEGMTSNVAKMISLAVKRKIVNYGNQVEGTKDIGMKLDFISKQIAGVAALELLNISTAFDKSILSKGMIVSALLEDFDSEEVPADILKYFNQ